jgi:hypothetical protein
VAIQHWRHLWRNAGAGLFTFGWDAIRHDSYVLVTAAEGSISDVVPSRFVGDAWFEVDSIAPFDGGVSFMVLWQVAYPRLNVWTDITIFDPNDPHGTN